MMSIITICVILLVILDANENFILKGDYIEPQNSQNTPLTPNNYYPSTNDDNNNYTVYITEYGEKYHKATCRYLTDSKIAIDIYEAIAEDYKPCSICKP